MLSCHILIKFDFSGQIFKKYINSDIKLHENIYGGHPVVLITK